MSDINTQSLPLTCRALIYHGGGQPLSVQAIPTPEAVPGSVIVRILASIIEAGSRDTLAGKGAAITFPSPFVPGARAIGRVATTGPDAVSLQVGQLVMLEPFVRARDKPDVEILWGLGMFGSDPMAKKLMEDTWRNGMYAEYARAPLENCHPLNEKILLGSPAEGGLGYSIADLTCLSRQLVAYGGFRGIDLKAGETVIVAPATGSFSGAAVEVASAMGARVIAVGRNLSALQEIAAVNPRVHVLQLKGDVQEDLASLKQFGTIDAYLDISPAVAANSTHVRSCMMAVRSYGRVSLMGGAIFNDIAIPYALAVLKNLTIRGQYMYEREDARDLIKLAETGVLKLGKSVGHKVVGEYKLEEWEEALETAHQNPGAGKTTLFTP